MLKQLKKEANLTTTENNAVTYRSSDNHCLDLFSCIGALRDADVQTVVSKFEKAFAEDKETAMKILFFARDIRGGLGERRVFNIILHHLADNYPESVLKNIDNVEEYGRFDDLTALFFTQCDDAAIRYIKYKLDIDDKAENPSLLAKWLPSINASNKDGIRYAKHLANKLGLSNEAYRKLLVRIRAKIKIIENNLRVKDYTFDYSAQPSKAMFKYKKAFIRNDGVRYAEFLKSVEKGETTLNIGTLYLYDIVRNCLDEYISSGLKKTLDITWKQMCKDKTFHKNALAVIDGSGSMYGGGNPLPITVAISLGIYFSENGKGEYANHFITFSKKPKLVEIQGEDIFQKVRYCMSYNEVANTDLEKVFDLILKTAKKNKLAQSELPDTLYIISDMEFDCCVEHSKLSNFENAKKMFEKAGYKLPKIIFWNVQARREQVPVKYNEQNVALISGASAKIFDFALSDDLNPLQFMTDILNEERYRKIKA